MHWQLVTVAAILLGFAAVSGRLEGTSITAAMFFTAAGIVVASAPDPSGKGGARSNVLFAKLAAHHVSPAHADSLPTISA